MLLGVVLEDEGPCGVEGGDAGSRVVAVGRGEHRRIGGVDHMMVQAHRHDVALAAGRDEHLAAARARPAHPDQLARRVVHLVVCRLLPEQVRKGQVGDVGGVVGEVRDVDVQPAHGVAQVGEAGGLGVTQGAARPAHVVAGVVGNGRVEVDDGAGDQVAPVIAEHVARQEVVGPGWKGGPGVRRRGRVGRLAPVAGAGRVAGREPEHEDDEGDGAGEAHDRARVTSTRWQRHGGATD